MWVVWIGVGPVFVSFLNEWYIAHGTHILVQAEAIITELVFEHALRIRMKDSEDSQAKGKSPAASAQAGDGKKSTKQLLGKITNLVTSDLRNIQQARDFPVVGKSLRDIAVF